MTYANNRFILDADSHVMEPVDFLDDFLNASERERFHNVLKLFGGRVEEGEKRAAERRKDAAAKAEAERRLMLDKSWNAIGAWDVKERARALDLLGFSGQLVFPTFANIFLLPLGGSAFPDYAVINEDLDLLYAWAKAVNQRMVKFCDGDSRLLPVGFVSLVDPERAVTAAKEAIEMGCAAILIPSIPTGGRAPTHPDLDPFWALLESHDTPFVLHVGGSGATADPAFHNNGLQFVERPGDGEHMRSKDLLALYQSPPMFLGALILDGLFDRFPKLRGGCVEQAAGWVPSWMRQLDHVHRALNKFEAPLRRLKLKPSEYVRRHLKFTPAPAEDVGWIIEQAGPEVVMFSSDFPHPEGTDDPIGRFESTLEHISEGDKQRFYSGNMAALLGERAQALI